MKNLALLFAFFCLNFLAARPNLEIRVTSQPLASLVAADTKVVFEIERKISFTAIAPGDAVILRCRKAFVIDGKVVLRAGDLAAGEIGLVRSATPNTAAALGIVPREMRATDGSVVRFEPRPEIFEAMVVGEDFLEIEAGTMFTARTTAFPPEELLAADSTAAAAPADSLKIAEENSAADPDVKWDDNPHADGEPQTFQVPSLDENFSIPQPDEAAASAVEAAPAAGLEVPAGLEIELELDDELVPEQAKIGDTLAMRVADDVEFGDDERLAFRAGAPAWGRIKHLASGAIYVVALSAEAADGAWLPLRSLSFKFEFESEEASDLLRLEGELVGAVLQIKSNN